MTDLSVRAVMTGDGSGLVGAARLSQDAIDRLRASAQRYFDAQKNATPGVNAHGAATEGLTLKTRALRGAMEEVAIATGGTSGELFAASRAAIEVAKEFGVAGIAAVAIAAGFAGLAAHTIAYQGAVRDLNIDLATHHNYLALTAEGVEKLIDDVAKAGNLSHAGAANLIDTLLPSGADADQIKKLATDANALGISLEDLGRMAQKPEDAVKQLNDRYHELNDAQVSMLPPGMNGLLALMDKLAANAKQNEDRTRGWTGALKDFIAQVGAAQMQIDTGIAKSNFVGPGPTPGAMPIPGDATGTVAAQIKAWADAQRQGQADMSTAWAAYWDHFGETQQAALDKAAQEEAQGLEEIHTKIAQFEAQTAKEEDEAAKALGQSIVEFYQKTAAAAKQNVDEIENAFGQLPQSYNQAAEAALKWRDEHIQALKDAGQATDEMLGKVDQIYEHDLEQAYQDDLKNRTDWKAGVERANQDIVKSHSDMAAQSEKFIKGFDKTAEDVFAKFVTTGKLDVKSLVDFVIEQFARMAYEKYIASSVSSFGSTLLDFGAAALGYGGGGGYTDTSGFADTGVSFAHSGGTIGVDNFASRYVHPANFDGAQRFHSGGLLPGEVPIVVQQGEAVFTPRQMDNADALLSSAMGAASQRPTVIVNINKTQGGGDKVTQSQGPNGELRIDVMVDLIDGEIGKRIQTGRSQTGQAVERFLGGKRSA